MEDQWKEEEEEEEEANRKRDERSLIRGAREADSSKVVLLRAVE